MEAFRDEMSRFAESEVTPHAHEWHLKDAYIPMEIIEQMAEMGVFGLTIPERLRRIGPWQREHVRGLRGLISRLHRRGIARHPLGNRRRIDPVRRHREAEAKMAADDRLGRDFANRRFQPSRTPALTLPA